MRCQFCNNMVMVPPEMRAHTTSVPKPLVVDDDDDSDTAVQPVGSSSSSGFRLLIGLIAIIGAVIVIITLVIATITTSVVNTVGGVLPAIAAIGPTATPAVSVVATFGGEGTGAGLFTSPDEFAVDGKGYIYVSDRDTGLIQRFDANGQYLSRWQPDPKAKYGPTCLTADHTGNVFACGTSGFLKFDGATGKLLDTLVGDKTATSSDFFRSGAAALLDGSLLVYESSHDQVVKLSPTGKVLYRTDTISSHLGKNQTTFNVQIVVDGLGNSYVFEEITGYILQYKADGTFVNRFGGKGDGQDQFQNADAIAVDSRSQLYVLDGWANEIKVLDREGHYLTSYPLPSAANRVSALSMGFDNVSDLYILGVDKKLYKLHFAANR